MRAVPGRSVVETERLLLRPLAPADLEDFAAIFSDPEVTRYLGYDAGDYGRSRRELEFWIDAHERRGTGMSGVVHKADGRLIGRCGFAPWELDGMREIELSFVLNRSYWGQGIATEAVAALRDHGFQACGFQRLVSLLHPDNTASERVARKVGMTFERDVHSVTQSLSLFAVHRP